MKTIRFTRLCVVLPGLLHLLPVAVHAQGIDQLVYVPLAQPCRLLDTRASTGGPGPLVAGTAYLFGTDNTSIESTAQHGSSTGCNIPAGIEAVSVNMNMFDASAAGNIATWNPDFGTTAPNVGTGVYNPSVQYNTGYSSIPVGAQYQSGGGTTANPNAGKFYLQVANGQIDMTINLVGYWLPASWNAIRGGAYAVAFGYGAEASGYASTALGNGALARGNWSAAIGANPLASGAYSTAMGQTTTASGYSSTATGWKTTASGTTSTAIGYDTLSSGAESFASGFATTASGDFSTATGFQTTAGGSHSTAMGTNASDTHFNSISGYVSRNHSFVYGDGSANTISTADNQFMARASGGFIFYTSTDTATGTQLPAGSGSWTSLSDRNAKDGLRAVDTRSVLERVLALPLSTWRYKTQEAKYRHMGPMAQDFYAAFHLGETDKGIDDIDAQGVALAAIQGLNAKLEEDIAAKDAEIVTLRAEKNREIAALRDDKAREIASLHARIDSLESLARRVSRIEAKLTMSENAAAITTLALHP